jgi:hypothetical protein
VYIQQPPIIPKLWREFNSLPAHHKHRAALFFIPVHVILSWDSWDSWDNPVFIGLELSQLLKSKLGQLGQIDQ